MALKQLSPRQMVYREAWAASWIDKSKRRMTQAAFRLRKKDQGRLSVLVLSTPIQRGDPKLIGDEVYGVGQLNAGRLLLAGFPTKARDNEEHGAIYLTAYDYKDEKLSLDLAAKLARLSKVVWAD